MSARVPAVELASPSVPLVNSESVAWPFMAMLDAAFSCSDATSPPPDDANAHMNRKTTKKGGGENKDMLSACIGDSVGGQDRHRSPLHYAAHLGSTTQSVGHGLQAYG
ncbi:hypothetical protein NDU88_001776 [Pleurodeles waltl]|uniref:Uncharacterized protein n=1 Tax=Pleurodeles waltl TaxID=8319 RepID=A0AAV7PDH6_PLEWA|nr:hypothetical protein NDU88_001776 [Pleurodeles waltl]